MHRTWTNRVRHVLDGEPVNGAIDSRPTRTLEDNAHYLKGRIDAAELGEGVCAHGETVEPGVLVGMPVYRNHAAARYERALAAVEHDPQTGVLYPSASADCIGIVVFKHNATKADILLSGRRQVDIAAATSDGVAAPGRYYLSGFEAGKLVRQRPPVSVSVLVYTDDGIAIVQPVQRDFLEDHIHYRVRLHARPAGTNVLGAGLHSVGAPDPALPGWLPAGHASFGGRAPAGAAFGYNLAAHLELARIFPPIPASAAAVFLDRGANRVGGTLVPMGPGGLCHVDRGGIWWMSNCQGDVPWPETWSAPLLDLEGNDPGGPECPRLEEFQVILAYTTMVFTTERSAVTSLRPAANSPLRFTNCDGDDATTGDLEGNIDLSFLVGPGEVDGSLVFKELVDDTFRLGRVIEGLKAGPGCELISTHPQALAGGEVLHRGTVEVIFNTAPGERELPVDLIRLAQTQERFHLEIPYIGLDAGRDTSLRMRFHVPPDGLPGTPRVRLRMQVLGRSAGTLPALEMTYRILPRPSTPTGLPGLVAELPLAVDTTVAVGADQYVEVQSAQVAVAAGDTILVHLLRNHDDGYAGEVGVMRPVGILTGTAP